MRLKLPKIKIVQLLFSLKYLYVLIIILLVGIFGFLGMFLYNNFYQTIAQSQEVILLKQEVAPDMIDVDKITSILASLDKKNTTTENIKWEEIKNPFFSPSQPVPAPPESPPTPEAPPLPPEPENTTP